jgi:hypothetical protein
VRKITNPKFRRRRASKGGVARARRYSRLWQELMMFYLSERRAKRTQEPTFKQWLLTKGLGRVLDTAVVR